MSDELSVVHGDQHMRNGTSRASLSGVGVKIPRGKGRQSWAPTAEAWNRFLALLNLDREAAAVEYEKIYRKLLTFFRSRGCWDAEECADETIDRTVRRIDEVRVLIPFMLGVARRVASEFLRSRPMQLAEFQMNRLVAPSANSDETAASERRLECLEHCLQLLAPADREFILAYYSHEKAEKIESKKFMAKLFDISRENLRVRAFRLRRELARSFRATHAA